VASGRKGGRGKDEVMKLEIRTLREGIEEGLKLVNGCERRPLEWREGQIG